VGVVVGDEVDVVVVGFVSDHEFMVCCFGVDVVFYGVF